MKIYLLAETSREAKMHAVGGGTHWLSRKKAAKMLDRWRNTNAGFDACKVYGVTVTAKLAKEK